MVTTLSSKGQIVLPKQIRSRLHLRIGTTFTCTVRGDSIVLVSQEAGIKLPRLVKDPRTGLILTKSSENRKVTSADVRQALAEFP
ncbi:MAG: AbrB/MazE/SpoVT family DNA-binding domain-containing protein [Blastochloris sp.]|nr:AbrB/MazE/SpoVT family DNA-binding domain-containing protein [Blastochloris sp.]